MTPKVTFNHCNINVTDTERSLRFYRDALGLEPQSTIEAPDGSFLITYLTDGTTPFRLELTWLRDHPERYDLGENESHIAFRAPTQEAFARLFQHHQEMGVVCYENREMGIYFIEDPDGYWLEVIPPRM